MTTTLGSDTADFIDVTGGSLTAASLSLGRTGLSDTTQPTAGSTTAGLYINGGAVNILANLDMGISSAANSTVNTRMDSGSLTVGGVLTIGLNNGGRWSVVDVNGGTLTVTNTTTGISVGGPLSGNAELLIRNGTVNAGIIGLGQTAAGSTNMTAVINMTNGALYVGGGGIVQVSTGVGFVSTITLNGGVLGAGTNWTSTNNIRLGSATIQTADALGNPWNIGLSGILSGTNLLKSGAGTLTLGGVNTYSGRTAISNGVLALAVTGLITNTAQVSIASNATFDVSALTGYTFSGASPVQTLAGISTSGAANVNATGNALTLAAGAKVLLQAAGTAKERTFDEIALNDVVISRGIASRLIELDVCVDGDPLTRYRCDGLIVSSPTGSTAYSLAAGGAVVFPTAEVLALTPICPHTLSNRSLILPLNATIEVEVISPKPATILSADGQVVTELAAGDRLRIRRGRRTVRLIRLAGSSFCETLRRKLHWRGATL